VELSDAEIDATIVDVNWLGSKSLQAFFQFRVKKGFINITPLQDW
jgi:hypothetical protein